MNKQKIISISLITLLLVSAIGLTVFYFTKDYMLKEVNLNIEEGILEDDELVIDSWIRYTHEDGYTFMYPSEWILDLKSGSGPKMSILFSQDFKGLSFYGGPAEGSRINIDRYNIIGWNGSDSISGIKQPDTVILGKPAAYYEDVKSDYGAEFYRITTDIFWDNENILKVSLENPINEKYLNKDVYDILLKTVKVE